MRIRILGSAAGGGFPQWNCGCPGCRAVRDGSRPATPRTQSSIAVSPDGRRWWLVVFVRVGVNNLGHLDRRLGRLALAHDVEAPHVGLLDVRVVVAERVGRRLGEYHARAGGTLAPHPRVEGGPVVSGADGVERDDEVHVDAGYP